MTTDEELPSRWYRWNPYSTKYRGSALLRVAACATTGILIGVTIDHLPYLYQFVVVTVLAVGLLIYLIRTELWMRRTQRDMSVLVELDAKMREVAVKSRDEIKP